VRALIALHRLLLDAVLRGHDGMTLRVFSDTDHHVTISLSNDDDKTRISASRPPHDWMRDAILFGAELGKNEDPVVCGHEKPEEGTR
jgi:hypothetical protein